MFLVQVDYVKAVFQLPQIGPAARICQVDLHEATSLRVEDPGSSVYSGHFGRLHHTRYIFQLIPGKLRDEDLFLYGTTSDIHFFLARKIFVARRRVSLPYNK